VQADFKAIETALKIYRLDNYVYPTTEQGLEALVEPSPIDPQPRNFKEGGYLAEVPRDPWGRPYLYLSPGENGEVDIYTLGADGLAGGEDRTPISATGRTARARPMRRTAPGFSLIEMLVVLFVIVLLTSLVSPESRLRRRRARAARARRVADRPRGLCPRRGAVQGSDFGVLFRRTMRRARR
jgi:type II secretion system protein G